MLRERAGEDVKALEDYRTAFALFSQNSAGDPSDLSSRMNLAINRAHVGMQAARLGQPAAGQRQLDAAVETAEGLLSALALASEVSAAVPGDLESPLSVGKLHLAIGVVLGLAGRYAEAGRALEEAGERIAELLRQRRADAEAGYVSTLIADNTAALAGCVEGRPRRGTRRLRLPTLMN